LGFGGGYGSSSPISSANRGTAGDSGVKGFMIIKYKVFK
jgi:hypothetical protein